MSKGKSFVSVKILIFNEKNQLLILRRSEWKENPKYSHQPDIPGGMIDDEDDNGRIAAVREIEEETGIRCKPRDLKMIYAGTQYREAAKDSWTKLFYMLKLDHTPEIKISWEHDGSSWRTLDDAAKNVDLSYGLGRSDGLVIPYLYEHRDIFGV